MSASGQSVLSNDPADHQRNATIPRITRPAVTAPGNAAPPARSEGAGASLTNGDVANGIEGPKARHGELI
jgi:hypothetical protein